MIAASTADASSIVTLLLTKGADVNAKSTSPSACPLPLHPY